MVYHNHTSAVTATTTTTITTTNTLLVSCYHSNTFTGVGRDSAVGIATRYGLDGPEIESRWGRNFPHLFRLALGPNQHPIQWVPGLFPGGKAVGEWP